MTMTDEQLEGRLRATYHEVLPRLVPNVGGTAPMSGHRRGGRELAYAVAVVLVIAGVATVLALRRDPEGQDLIQTSPGSAASLGGTSPYHVDVDSATDVERIALVFDPAPNPLDLPITDQGASTGEVGGQSTFVTLLFGTADAPDEPNGMVVVEYAASESFPIGCTTSGTTTDLNLPPEIGIGCQYGSTRSLSRVTSAGISLSAYLGQDVTIDRAAALLDSLSIEPNASPDRGAPADVVADALPDGWMALVGDDLATADPYVEYSQVIQFDDDEDRGELWVRTESGIDNPFAWLRRPAAGGLGTSENVIVRGRPGVMFVSDGQGSRAPFQVTLWWQERPGVDVQLESSNLLEPDALLALAESLVAVDRGWFAEYGTYPSPEGPFDLYVHCGVEWLQFRGRWWRTDPLADGNGNPPAGWGNPYDNGQLTIVGLDTAEYTSSVGEVVIFQRTDSTTGPAVCS